MKYIFALAFMLWSPASFGFITSDSLTGFEELVFDSDFEKESFEKLLKGEEDYFELFSCLNAPLPGDVYQNKKTFEATVAALREMGLEKKKEEKKIKIIYNQVHQRFFKAYEMENYFNDIFTKGAYNCVSATAVYAMILDEMSIPYVIKEKPTHVYLVAYPEDQGIIVEATDPARGSIVYSATFKQTFVERMMKGKMIKPGDANTMSTDQLFGKYFFSDDDITLRQLAGVQYYNDGLYLMQKKKYLEAYNQLVKSDFLYPHERTGYSMLVAASSYISQLNLSDREYADFITKFADFSTFGVTSGEMKDEFIKLTNVWLFQKSDTATYNEIYADFIDIYQDSIYRKEIGFIYNYETGRYFAQLGRKTKALKMVEKAYRANPNNVQGQAFLIELIYNKVSRMNNAGHIMALLDDYQEEFPLLINNGIFLNMVTDNYLRMAHKMFYENKATEGLEYLDKFEQTYGNSEEKDINDKSIGVSYGSAAMYYFKKGLKTKAREMLRRGLKLSPGNQMLEARLRYIK